MKRTQISGKLDYIHGLEESILFKMSIQLKVLLRFCVIPSKMSMSFFTEIEKNY